MQTQPSAKPNANLSHVSAKDKMQGDSDYLTTTSTNAGLLHNPEGTSGGDSDYLKTDIGPFSEAETVVVRTEHDLAAKRFLQKSPDAKNSITDRPVGFATPSRAKAVAVVKPHERHDSPPSFGYVDDAEADDTKCKGSGDARSSARKETKNGMKILSSAVAGLASYSDSDPNNPKYLAYDRSKVDSEYINVQSKVSGHTMHPSSVSSVNPVPSGPPQDHEAWILAQHYDDLSMQSGETQSSSESSSASTTEDGKTKKAEAVVKPKELPFKPSAMDNIYLHMPSEPMPTSQKAAHCVPPPMSPPDLCDTEWVTSLGGIEDGTCHSFPGCRKPASAVQEPVASATEGRLAPPVPPRRKIVPPGGEKTRKRNVPPVPTPLEPPGATADLDTTDGEWLYSDPIGLRPTKRLPEESACRFSPILGSSDDLEQEVPLHHIQDGGKQRESHYVNTEELMQSFCPGNDDMTETTTELLECDPHGFSLSGSKGSLQNVSEYTDDRTDLSQPSTISSDTCATDELPAFPRKKKQLPLDLMAFAADQADNISDVLPLEMCKEADSHPEALIPTSVSPPTLTQSSAPIYQQAPGSHLPQAEEPTGGQRNSRPCAGANGGNNVQNQSSESCDFKDEFKKFDEMLSKMRRL